MPEKQMGLKECAKYDHDNGIAAIMTGWGLVSRDRQVKGISRKARREKKKAESQNKES
jgi:hypothetical protein